jgi:hypothetical protein
LSKLSNENFVYEKDRWHIPGDKPVSNSSKAPEFAEGSSSSIYNPFVSSSSLVDLISVFPEELNFSDDAMVWSICGAFCCKSEQ